MMYSLLLSSSLCLFAGVASALASSASPPPLRSILVTGANKGQGLALCERILVEHDDTRVFLCSRDLQRGEDAATSLQKICGGDAGIADRIKVVQLDVTSPASVSAAVQCVRATLGSEGKLFGLVSNAGILWGYSLREFIDVCCVGVRRVLDEFLPLMQEEDGRIIVVSSGLGPLMHGYATSERQKAMTDPLCTWEDRIEPMIKDCLEAYEKSEPEQRPSAFEDIGFSGGPFADSAPDFHMYGIAKCFADAYMLSLARSLPSLRINSVDPGLVFTDLILRMPKYAGTSIDDNPSAQTPKMGVEAHMRLLFDKDTGSGDNSGRFYAMSKDKSQLLSSTIDKMPNK